MLNTYIHSVSKMQIFWTLQQVAYGVNTENWKVYLINILTFLL
jgi:hypothetical protein